MTFALPNGAKRADDWKTDLVRTLSDHGFQQCKKYVYRDGTTMARFWNDVLVAQSPDN